MCMKALTGIAAVALVAASFAAVSSFTSTSAHAQPAAAAPAPAPAAGAYKIDPVHSAAVYRITHLGASAHWGMIKAPSGTVELTDDSIKLDVALDLANLDSANAKRDEHLRGPDFFNAKQFPQMTFKSTAAKKSADGFDVTGDLTIKGVTKSIDVQLKQVGAGKGMKGEALVGYETEFTVNRLEYGVSFMPGAVGNDVKVIVAFEAAK